MGQDDIAVNKDADHTGIALGDRFRLYALAGLTVVFVGLCLWLAIPYLPAITWGVALAIIAWPMLLFASALALVARIARILGAPGPLAAVLVALDYPVTTLFMPGRIDHHGLQMVLLLVVVRAAVGGGSLAAGAAAGIATAASLVIGVETAPLLAIG